MARPLRLHVVDGWYHVMSRGNGGEDIYRRDEDRRRFLGLVSELPERFGTEIHAFVLMDNHYHLLVQCRRGTLSETLRWLQTTYAVRFNWRYRRHGHLFQGRFKSVLIQDETALDEVARYIHLNPVRIADWGFPRKISAGPACWVARTPAPNWWRVGWDVSGHTRGVRGVCIRDRNWRRLG